MTCTKEIILPIAARALEIVSGRPVFFVQKPLNKLQSQPCEQLDFPEERGGMQVRVKSHMTDIVGPVLLVRYKAIGGHLYFANVESCMSNAQVCM